MTAAEKLRLEKVVRLAARRYARKCWWADPAELEQEAWRWACEAAQTFDPDYGAPLEAYVWRAIINRLWIYLWGVSAPVSESQHHLKDLAGVLHTPLEVENASGQVVQTDGLNDRRPLPDEQADYNRWREALQQAVRGAILSGRDGWLAYAVLVREAQPAKVAAAHKVSVERVYDATNKARERLCGSYRLLTLWRQM